MAVETLRDPRGRVTHGGAEEGVGRRDDQGRHLTIPDHFSKNIQANPNLMKSYPLGASHTCHMLPSVEFFSHLRLSDYTQNSQLLKPANRRLFTSAILLSSCQ